MAAVVHQGEDGPQFYADAPRSADVSRWANTFAVRPRSGDLTTSDILILPKADDSAFNANLRVGGPTLLSAETPIGHADRVRAMARRTAMRCAFCADTRTAIEIDCPKALREALVEAGWLCGHAADDFEICAQEAISNALIHGNLGLGSNLRNTPEEYLRFAAMVDSRLADDALGLRPLDVGVWDMGDSFVLSVTDAGAGMTHVPVQRGFEAAAAGSGRGLALMRALSLDLRHRNRGRSCIMRFKRGGRA